MAKEKSGKMQSQRTIAIANQKGGACKTTTTVNLAAALVERGCQALVIDLDPQASATAWLDGEDAGHGLYRMFMEEEDLANLVVEGAAGVHLVPASSGILSMDTALVSEPGASNILKIQLKGVHHYDYILIDCPPSLDLLSINALIAAGEVLVPVEASITALAGLGQLMDTVSKVKSRGLNRRLKYAGILTCRVDRRRRHAQDVAEVIQDQFSDLALKTCIRENVRVQESWGHRQPVTQYAPRSTGAEDYRALAQEIEEQTHG